MTAAASRAALTASIVGLNGGKLSKHQKNWGVGLWEEHGKNIQSICKYFAWHSR